MSLSTAVVLGMAGCSSSSDDGGVQGSLDTVLSGVGIDGYLSQATVCVDLNEDGYCQVGDSTSGKYYEPASYTDEKGQFSLTLTAAQKLAYPKYAEAPLLIYNGFDIDTGVEFTGKLRAPLGDGTEVNVSPISTMVHSIMKDNKTKEAAETLVKDMLGLASTVDLGEDPVAAAKKDPTLLKASLKLQKTVEVLAAAKAQAGSTDSKNKLVEDLYADLAKKAGAATTDADKKLAAAVGAVVTGDTELDTDAEDSATAITGQIDLIIGDKGVADTAVIGTQIGAVKQEIVVAIENNTSVPTEADLTTTANTEFSLLHAKEILRIVNMENITTTDGTLAGDVQTVLKAKGMTETEFLPVDTEIEALKADARTFLVGAKFDDVRNAAAKAEKDRLEAEAKAAAEKAKLEAKIAELKDALAKASEAEKARLEAEKLAAEEAAAEAEAKAKADAQAAAKKAEADRLARLAEEAANAESGFVSETELKKIQDEKDAAEAEQAAAEKIVRIQEQVSAVIAIDSEVTTTMLDVDAEVAQVTADMEAIYLLDKSYPLGTIASDANSSANAAADAVTALNGLVKTIASEKRNVLEAQGKGNEENANSAKESADAAFATFGTTLKTAQDNAKIVADKLVAAKKIKEEKDNVVPVAGAYNVFTLPFEWSETDVYNDNGIDVLKIKRNMVDNTGLVTETREKYNLATGALIEEGNTQDDLEYKLVDGAWVTVDTKAQAHVTLSNDGTVAHYSIINADLRIVSVTDLSGETTLPLNDGLSIPIVFSEGATSTLYEYKMLESSWKLNQKQENYTTTGVEYFTSLEDFIGAFSSDYSWFMGSHEGGVTFADDINTTLRVGDSGNMKEISQNNNVSTVVNANVGTWKYIEIDPSGINAIVFDITSGKYADSDERTSFFTMYEGNVYRGDRNEAMTKYQDFGNTSFNKIAYEDAKTAIESYFTSLPTNNNQRFLSGKKLYPEQRDKTMSQEWAFSADGTKAVLTIDEGDGKPFTDHSDIKYDGKLVTITNTDIEDDDYGKSVTFEILEITNSYVSAKIVGGDNIKFYFTQEAAYSTSAAAHGTPFVLPTLTDGKAFYEVQLEDHKTKINYMQFPESKLEFGITNVETKEDYRLAYSQNEDNLTIMNLDRNETLDVLHFSAPTDSNATYFATATQQSGPTINYYFEKLSDAQAYVDSIVSSVLENIAGKSYTTNGWSGSVNSVDDLHLADSNSTYGVAYLEWNDGDLNRLYFQSFDPQVNDSVTLVIDFTDPDTEDYIDHYTITDITTSK